MRKDIDKPEKNVAKLKRANEQLKKEIDERKRAEEELRETRDYLNKLFDYANAPVIVWNPEFKIIRFNHAFEHLTGHNAAEIIGKNLGLLFPESSQKESIDKIKRTSSGEYWESVEIPILHKDGDVKIALWNSANIYDADGKTIIATIAQGQNITLRKQAEEALLESEEKYRLLVETAVEIIIVIDIEGKIAYANKAAHKISGYTENELSEINIKNFLPADKLKALTKNLAKRIAGDMEPRLCEASFISKKGSRVPVEVNSAAILKEGKPTGVLITAREITVRKKMEEELLKAQKLESLGVLAGGIAHDFNNLLTAIMGNITLTQMDMQPGSKAFQHLVEAEKASLRARELTQQFITFSKGGEPVKKLTSISGLLKDSVKLTLSGSKVRCDFSIPDNLWKVEIDEGQIRQVINGLINNAKEAMPEGGVVKVSADNISLDPGIKKYNLPFSNGTYVKIYIQDQGIGIPEENLAKIFDPYFSTKKMGIQKGMGLGLAMAFSVINKHQGYIDVKSEIGTGTTFYTYLPAFEKEVVVAKETGKEQLIAKGRILVMDDEKMVKDVAGKMLSRIGYEVEFAGDGALAIELYKKAKDSPEPFDVVILDLTVPGGMGGMKTIERLKKIDPDVKAVVSSGYAEDPVMTDFKKYGFSGSIGKPYSMSELEKAVDEVMKPTVFKQENGNKP